MTKGRVNFKKDYLVPHCNQRTSINVLAMNQQTELRKNNIAGNTKTRTLSKSVKFWDSCKGAKMGYISEAIYAIAFPEAYTWHQDYDTLMEAAQSVNKSNFEEKLESLGAIFNKKVILTGCTRFSICVEMKYQLKKELFSCLDDRFLKVVGIESKNKPNIIPLFTSNSVYEKNITEAFNRDKHFLTALRLLIMTLIASYNEESRTQKMDETSNFYKKMLDLIIELNDVPENKDLLTFFNEYICSTTKPVGATPKTLKEAYLYDRLRETSKIASSTKGTIANLAGFIADVFAGDFFKNQLDKKIMALESVGINPYTLDCSSDLVKELSNEVGVLKAKGDVSYVSKKVKEKMKETQNYDVLSVLKSLHSITSNQKMAEYIVDTVKKNNLDLQECFDIARKLLKEGE